MSAPPRFRGDSPVEFTSYLAELKQRGCNLLVTGEVGERVTQQATRRLLGSAAERRRRVLVLADHSTSDGRPFLPHGVAPGDDDVAIIAWDAGARSAVSRTTTPDRDPGVARLQAEICSAITRLDVTAGGLEPAELRLGVVTVGLLLDRYDFDEVRHVLAAVTAQVRNVSGMGHYHLPVPDDDDAVDALDELFDARIELRQADGVSAEQRWHVPEYGATTWVTL